MFIIRLNRFPKNLQERGLVQEVWCQETGPQWLIKNKYIAVTINVSTRPYVITDVLIQSSLISIFTLSPFDVV